MPRPHADFCNDLAPICRRISHIGNIVPTTASSGVWYELTRFASPCFRLGVTTDGE